MRSQTIQEQQNLHPNSHKKISSNLQNQLKNVDLKDLIRENINYQHDQTIKKTLMKQSLMKISLDKDFKTLFNHNIFNNQSVMKQEEQYEQDDNNSNQNLLEVPQQIKEICQWLQQSDQYAGMAYVPLNSYTKLFHVIHQKVQTVSIIITEYPLYYLNKMENLNRLSKLKWAFLNSSLDQQEKIRILENYELKKIKLLFISPSLLKNQSLTDFDTELLVFCDLQHYKNDVQFVNNIISRCKPGRVLGIYPTLLQNSMEIHQKNNFHFINKVNPTQFNYITLKCTKQEKQKSVITYLNKNPQLFQKTLILINKKTEANQLVKKMNMDGKSTVNIFDYLSTNDLIAFNSYQIFSKSDKIKQEEKVLQAFRKIRNSSQILISTYSDILKFEQFDLVVFYNFTDVKKFVQNCSNAKNKLLLFDQDDYYNFRNSLTADYINFLHLQRQITKIIQKQQKRDNTIKKRFYSDYIDDPLLNKYSTSKHLVQKDQYKNLKINNFCKINNLTIKNFLRIIDGLVQLGIIQINCKAILEIQIQQECISSFRKSFPELDDIRRKVNILESSTKLQIITKDLLENIKKAGIRYKIIQQVLQFKVLINYEDINWQQIQQIVNKKLMQTIKILDYSLDILRQCAYSSIQLTRRQKVLQRKDILLKFSIKKSSQQILKAQQNNILNINNNINESFHKSNLLTSEIQEYLRTSDEGITDSHQLVMLLQGVQRTKLPNEKEQWIFGRYRKMKYEELIEAVNKIFKNKKVKLV